MQKETTKIFIRNRIKTPRLIALKNNLYKISISILIFLIACILFYSCSDNTITPKSTTNPIKDSSIFNWKLINIKNLAIYNMYVADTNHIFFESGPQLSYFNGDSVIILDDPNHHFPINVDGFNSQNVFFGGITPTSPEHTSLKKWNGSSLQDIQFPDYDTNTTLGNIIVTGPDEVWMALKPNYIYHYENSIFTLYTLPFNDLFQPEFFKDITGDLYLFGSIGFSNNRSIFYTFKFNGNTWENILKDTVIDNVSEYTLEKGKCGLDYVRNGLHGVYKFNGNGWTLAVQISGIYMSVFAGKNSLKFLSAGTTATDGNTKLYFYTGSQYLFQSNFTPSLPQYTITSLSENHGYYFGALLTLSYPNYFFKGKPKE